MSIAETGVYWPFKSLLAGAGININETPTSIQIVATGGTGGPGGGDMLQSVYAPTGVAGTVDKALHANNADNVTFAATAGAVPWTGVTGAPTAFPTTWTYIANKPSVFAPSAHAVSHGDGGSDPIGPYPLTMLSAFQINQQAVGRWYGIYNGGNNSVVWAWANGPGLNLDTLLLYKEPSSQYLIEQYQNSAGGGVWSGLVVNTYAPDGYWTFRDNVRVITSCNLPGGAAAWTEASLLINCSANLGYCAIAFNSTNSWACTIGAWSGGGSNPGIWVTTSYDRFIQWSDGYGAILGSAIQAGSIGGGQLAYGAAATSLGYWPVSRGGDTMVGDLWVNKANATVIAYQDGNTYARLYAGAGVPGLTVRGQGHQPGGGNYGHIHIESTLAGCVMQMITQSGWVYELRAGDGGALYFIRLNDGNTFQMM